MDVFEAAERWVFGGNLSDKLFWPDNLDWSKASTRPPLETIPASPGRPSFLDFSDLPTKQKKFPSLHHLEKPQVRGEVLHFFANHELLAMELMALTILKFPQAPRTFLQGLVHTLRDEQKHLLFYMERMEEYGVEFGAVPVNRFFWQHLAPSKTLLEYTAGMALTFEQANLDFSHYYQKAFEKIGDHQTAEALKVVFDDEIRHVAHGLKWFEEWRDPEQSLWQSYQQALKFPITPQRAKGKVFLHEARERAGLHRDFNRQLEVYSHSTGRLPRVFLFNPDAEDENAALRNYQRPKLIEKMMSDLSFLPAIFSHQSDILLLPKKPRKDFLMGWQNAGLDLPEILTIDEFQTRTKERELLSFEPWGYTPRLEKWQEGKSLRYRHQNLKTLARKTWSRQLLQDYIEQSDEHFLCDSSAVGREVQSMAELQEELAVRASGSHQQLVLKAPLGASGRNFQWLKRDQDSFLLLEHQENWSRRILREQGALIVEPWLEKEFDYSLQIHVEADGSSRIVGQARFLVDQRGRYQGALLGGFTLGLNSEQQRLLNDSGRDVHRMKKHFAELKDFVAQRATENGFHGPIGIDALVYRDHSGCLKVKPIVETNCRWNMGRLVVDLEKKLRLPGVGLWQVQPPSSEKTPWENFRQLHRDGFQRDGYYFFEVSGDSIYAEPEDFRPTQKKGFSATLYWGPDLQEIFRRLGKNGM